MKSFREWNWLFYMDLVLDSSFYARVANKEYHKGKQKQFCFQSLQKFLWWPNKLEISPYQMLIYVYEKCLWIRNNANQFGLLIWIRSLWKFNNFPFRECYVAINWFKCSNYLDKSRWLALAKIWNEIHGVG